MNTHISLRPWKLADAKFIIKLRNKPQIMQWFRQNHRLTLKEQKKFMLKSWWYNGRIIELNRRPVGVAAVQESGELCLVLPTRFPFLGHVLDLLFKEVQPYHEPRLIWGDVFVKNPLLPRLLLYDFKATEVGTLKKGSKLIDTVRVEIQLMGNDNASIPRPTKM